VSLTAIDAVLERACRAPSVHNTQPWRWQVSDDEVGLHADLFRRCR
jgi:nitroreductase